MCNPSGLKTTGERKKDTKRSPERKKERKWERKKKARNFRLSSGGVRSKGWSGAGRSCAGVPAFRRFFQSGPTPVFLLQTRTQSSYPSLKQLRFLRRDPVVQDPDLLKELLPKIRSSISAFAPKWPTAHSRDARSCDRWQLGALGRPIPLLRMIAYCLVLATKYSSFVLTNTNLLCTSVIARSLGQNINDTRHISWAQQVRLRFSDFHKDLLTSSVCEAVFHRSDDDSLELRDSTSTSFTSAGKSFGEPSHVGLSCNGHPCMVEAALCFAYVEALICKATFAAWVFS